MSMNKEIEPRTYNKALEMGRPPNIQKLFPNSRALIVSGKVIDRAMRGKGKAMTIAANARNTFVVRGALRAAQRANAAIIVEIARSEGGANAYCPVNYWNLATYVDAIANEMGITVPVAIHADHYGLKKPGDLAMAEVEVPTMFEAGITSIAIDASHMPDDDNLLTTLALAKHVPSWAGLETEVGEIKGKEGLSTPQEALFLIRGLNAHGVHADWIALNNGTTHGIEASDAGIQVELTASIHEALAPYKISGAQHGTSGNSSERLRQIAGHTMTTKANVATALQMLSWGVKVNDYGNAELQDGQLVKVANQGVTDALWAEMMQHAKDKGWKTSDTKKLNLPFDNKLQGQPLAVRERMVRAVEEFTHKILTEVFNAQDTAQLAVDSIFEAGSYDMGPKATVMEKKEAWTEEKIRERAKTLGADKGPQGDFED